MGNSKPDRPHQNGPQLRNRPSAHPMGDIGSMREIINRIDKGADSSKHKGSENSHLVLEQRPFAGDDLGPDGRNPLNVAEEILKAASDVPGARRVELARQALEVCRDCADAYVILAEETARSLEGAKRLYEEGVTAGARAIGEGVLHGDPEKFGAAPGSQSYIRARTGLARCLWSMGDKQEAIGHCAEILRLNPSDQQGVRHILANWLLHEGLQQDLASLFEAFEDDTETSWLYTRALWAFGQEGACQKADEYLQEALRQNPYVPSYLLGLKKMPGILPRGGHTGDEREAISYIAEALNIWLKTDGALEWLIMTLPRVFQHTRPESP
jgi:tetratricopeptide (TPR) repeat protein